MEFNLITLFALKYPLLLQEFGFFFLVFFPLDSTELTTIGEVAISESLILSTKMARAEYPLLGPLLDLTDPIMSSSVMLQVS